MLQTLCLQNQSYYSHGLLIISSTRRYDSSSAHLNSVRHDEGEADATALSDALFS